MRLVLQDILVELLDFPALFHFAFQIAATADTKPHIAHQVVLARLHGGAHFCRRVPHLDLQSDLCKLGRAPVSTYRDRGGVTGIVRDEKSVNAFSGLITVKNLEVETSVLIRK